MSEGKKKETIGKTILVAATLCIVCSIIVSTAAVMLKPTQVANKNLDFKRNILAAAGLLDASASVEEQFKKVEQRIVDFDAGKFSDEVDPADYDQRRAARDPAMSEALTKQDDIAGLSRREKLAEVYIVRENDELKKIILPIRGYGLWSTLHGFIALEDDLNTVVGLGYYEHAETPGLGGEVDNPRWKASWEGKKIYGEDGDVNLSIVKGGVNSSTPNAEYKVDALSGATLTSNGVDNMIKYWLGEDGYKSFLRNLKNGEA